MQTRFNRTYRQNNCGLRPYINSPDSNHRQRHCRLNNNNNNNNTIISITIQSSSFFIIFTPSSKPILFIYICL